MSIIIKNMIQMHSVKFIKYIGFLPLCILIVACNVRSEQKNEISISPQSKNISCPVSNILSSIKVVTLETNPNSLIDYFNNPIYIDTNNIIFISYKSIIIFDGKGKFVNRIDALGRGPEEYESICTAFADPVKKHIYIVDYENIKIFNFDGRYINTLKLPSSSGGVYRKSNGEMVVVCNQVYSNNDRDMLHLLDSSYNIYHTFKSRNPAVCKDVQQNLFYMGQPYEIDGHLYYHEQFVDTIFEVSDTMLIPHWSIDMGGRGFKTEDGINTTNFHKDPNKIPPIGLQETRNYFFIDYTYNNSKYLSVFDKSKNKYIFHKRYGEEYLRNTSQPVFGLKNDLIEDAPLFWPAYVNKNIIVSITNTSKLDVNQLKKLGCKADDNPVLFIGELKQNKD